MCGRGSLGLGAGLVLAAALHALGGVRTAEVAAQSPSNSTMTQSTSSSTSFESPPACSAVGSARQVQVTTFEVTVGPGCIGIGNRDIVNPSPQCAGLPPWPALDPGRGTVFLVPFGNQNLNTNINTETIQCVAAVPALPIPLLFGLGGALAALGAYGARRLTRRA